MPAPLSGLALPAVKQNGSHYFDAKTGIAAAWGDVLMAVLVARGTRPLDRSFGSAIHRYLFEPNSGRTRQMLQYIVETTVAKYAPHVNVVKVLTNSNGQSLQLSVTFSMAHDPTPVEQSVDVPMASIMSLVRGN